MFGLMIETCTKFYVVSSPQYMIKVTGMDFFMLDFYNVSFCKAFDGFHSCLA